MESTNRPIIVAWDFTQVAEYAFEHAILINNVLHREIILLHIISGSRNHKPVLKKLQKVCSELKLQFGVNSSAMVKSGNIFDTISQTALDLKAEVIVMGTHGIKGFQKFTGSKALKVIVNSKVPFVVVQDKPKKPKYENIILPIDFRSETKEKVPWVGYLSKRFEPKFFLFRRKASDRGFKRRIMSNLRFLESYFRNNDIWYELHNAPGKRSFDKETINFAKEKDADMILVITTRNISTLDYVLGAKEQKIIANPEKLPVMCINPKPGKFSAGFSASGG